MVTLQWLQRLDVVRFRRPLAILLNVMLAGVFAVVLYQQRESVPLVAHAFTPSVVGACLLLYLISLLLQFSVWMSLMDYRAGERARALEEYICTIFMGRLPGGIWKLIGRMTVYRASHLSARAVIAVNIVELLLALVANGVILLLLSDTAVYIRISGIVGLLAAARLMTAYITRRLDDRQQDDVGRARWSGWIICYMLSWLAGASILHLVVSPFSTAITFTDSLRYWCIAGAAGLLTQFLPLSILIRDATIVGMLQSAMPLSTAVLAAFAIRLMLMAGELISGWAVLAAVRGRLFAGVPAETNPNG